MQNARHGLDRGVWSEFASVHNRPPATGH